jgi:uncharacterized membrane protein YeaQ/YmgE (transglycosylase-associated protein family)
MSRSYRLNKGLLAVTLQGPREKNSDDLAQHLRDALNRVRITCQGIRLPLEDQLGEFQPCILTHALPTLLPNAAPTRRFNAACRTSAVMLRSLNPGSQDRCHGNRGPATIDEDYRSFHQDQLIQVPSSLPVVTLLLQDAASGTCSEIGRCTSITSNGTARVHGRCFAESHLSNVAQMNFIACIVVGILAGWIAERLMGRDHGLLMNLIVGIAGASLGGFLATHLLGVRYDEGFNLATLAVATFGAVVLLAIFGGMRRIPTLR